MRALDPRLLRRARGARRALAADVALGLLATVALLAQATLIATIVAGAFGGAPLDALAGRLALLAALALARGALAGAFEATGRRAAVGVTSQLRLELVGRRLRDAPAAADGAEAGEVATAAVQGVDALDVYFARYLPQLVLAVLVPVSVLVWAAAVDVTSAVIMLVTLPVVPLFMWLIGRYTEVRTRARWRALARLSNHFLDVMRGLTTLRAFNRGEAQAERIAEVSEDYRRATMQTLRIAFLSGAVLDLAATLATALVAVTLGLRLVDGDLTLRAALTVLLLTPELYAPIRALALQFHASADGLAAAERILDLLDVPAAVALADGAAAAPMSWARLRLEDVSLAYPGRPAAALDQVDLEIARGEIVALVGPSGTGKTTLAALLLGLQTPDSGRVSVDGLDLAEVDLAGWRREVAWVPQRPTLFHGSVRDNIVLGARDADDDQVKAAARRAGADAVVRELPRGYETTIGQGGRGLSAGETRRVALARALVRQAPLLVLDEPTADLDDTAAAVVGEAIRREAGEGRAVLVIEHRPSLARLADRVVVLDHGVATEVATEASPA
ncbi:MAG TPA: thiol reductant ABC exporter subunit CydD [Thermoleophilia bacterium]|nr:thiol reductant ABC exporter subunit CydD [Thermoleophilia bacterium]